MTERQLKNVNTTSKARFRKLVKVSNRTNYFTTECNQQTHNREGHEMIFKSKFEENRVS